VNRRSRRLGLGAAAIVVVVAAGAGAGWRFARAVDVPVVTVTQGAVVARVVGPGTVQARVPVTLAARVSATVVRVHADVGDAVRAGQPMITLDDRDLTARRAVVDGQRQAMLRNVEGARAALAKAQAELELARTRQQRDEQLLARGFVSQAVLDGSSAAARGAEAGVEAARATLSAREADVRTLAQEGRYADAVLSYARVEAPMDGVVIQRLVEPGTTVAPGVPLMKLVDPSTLWVATRVDESVVARVEPSQPASIRLRSGETVRGRVARIARQSDAATRELDVHVSFEAPPRRFAIDQEAEVTIEVGEDRGWTVPLAALLRDRAGLQGVLVIEDGRARFRPVRTAGADASSVIVVRGLEGGERVAATAEGLKAGTRVRPVTAAAR
jgi:HlyD family secretion protein